jgi:hypothetical protein
MTLREVEYPIWDWDVQQRGNWDKTRFSSWRLDISFVLKLKQKAIASYRSQITNLIDDDPQGFRLTPEMLANFTRPVEVYLFVVLLESDRLFQTFLYLLGSKSPVKKMVELLIFLLKPQIGR